MKSPNHKQLWGMVHVGPLPGTPRYEKNFESVVEKAVREAKALEQFGCTGILFENMHDVPYLKSHVGPEITAAMAVIGTEIRNQTKIPLGVQILAGANEAALSVAHAVGADWIRVEGFVFSHIADEGWIEACAGRLLRYRKELGASEIKIMADIKKKHSSHSITADVNIVETAKAAEFFGADAVVLTGASTGEEASVEELKKLKEGVSLPVLIGSGVTAQNISEYSVANGFIVGSFLKKGKDWKNELDPDAIQQITKSIQLL
ncbi:BtpA family membrane complex biogenesis protein [bacterium]|nr:BtpA family membrane complex biogenesis protein [bacterium]